MADRLFAYIFTDSYTTPVLIAAAHNIADLGISWEVPGGVRKIVLTTKMSPLAAYDAYRRYALQRLMIVDHYLDRPVATGDITKLTYGWGHLIIEADGPWWRLYDGLENTQAASSDKTDDIIEQALTDHASGVVDTSDYSDIAVMTAACAQGMPTGTATGTTASHLIDSAATFETDNVQPGDMVRNSTDSTIAIVMSVDSETDLTLDLNIMADTENYWLARPYVRGITTATKTSRLVDAGANFLRPPLENGNRVFNLTDGTYTTLSAAPTKETIVSVAADIFTVGEQYVIGATTIDWCPPYEGIPVADVIKEMCSYGNGAGLPTYFWLEDRAFNGNKTPQKLRPHFEAYSATAGADWQVWKRDMTRADIGRDFGNLATSVTALHGKNRKSTTATHNTSGYWTRDINISGHHAIAGLADERASVYVNQQSDAVLRRPWVIGSRRIQDGSGFSWPLWRMIAQGGGYLRINDAFPETALVTAGYDREQQGRIITLDYSYRRNLMRVVLDDDTRPDRRFRELGYDEALNRRLRSTMRPYT